MEKVDELEVEVEYESSEGQLLCATCGHMEMCPNCSELPLICDARWSNNQRTLCCELGENHPGMHQALDTYWSSEVEWKG